MEDERLGNTCERANTQQQELLVEKLHFNKDMARDNQAQQHIIDFWTAMSNELNHLGCSRTVAQWQRIWAIWVDKTMTKARKVQESLISTGGVPAEIDLTDIERKIIEIVGSASITGFCQLEVGLPSSIPPIESLNMLPPMQPVHEHTEANQPICTPVTRTRGRRPRLRASNNGLIQSLNENNRLLRESVETASENIAAALRENSAAIVRATEILAAAIQYGRVPSNMK